MNRTTTHSYDTLRNTNACAKPTPTHETSTRNSQHASQPNAHHSKITHAARINAHTNNKLINLTSSRAEQSQHNKFVWQMEKWKVIIAVCISTYLLKGYLFSSSGIHFIFFLISFFFFLFCVYLFFSTIGLLVIIGCIIGFVCALILHDNKYVAILAHIISSKLSRLTDASSLYDNDSITNKWK